MHEETVPLGLPGLWLLLMKGPPGSGKSTLARALSRQLGWPLIDKDDVRDLLDGSAPGLAYDIMLNVGRRQLLQGLSVICDSPLGYHRTYEHAMAIAHEVGATLAVVECRCPDVVVWRGRVEARRVSGLPTHHTTTWAAVESYLERTAADDGYTIGDLRLVIDTTRPVAELCAGVVQWLGQQGPDGDSSRVVVGRGTVMEGM